MAAPGLRLPTGQACRAMTGRLARPRSGSTQPQHMQRRRLHPCRPPLRQRALRQPELRELAVDPSEFFLLLRAAELPLGARDRSSHRHTVPRCSAQAALRPLDRAPRAPIWRSQVGARARLPFAAQPREESRCQGTRRRTVHPLRRRALREPPPDEASLEERARPRKTRFRLSAPIGRTGLQPAGTRHLVSALSGPHGFLRVRTSQDAQHRQGASSARSAAP
jgi:hypothetical protein